MELTQQANRTSSTSGRAKACRFCDSTDTSPERWPQARGKPVGTKCRACLAVYQTVQRHLQPLYKLKARIRKLRAREREHNVSYDDQLRLQMGGCASCGRMVEGVLCFDHNHRTGRFRGLLCSECNAAAGLLLDDPSRIRALADYIEHDGWEQIASLETTA